MSDLSYITYIHTVFNEDCHLSPPDLEQMQRSISRQEAAPTAQEAKRKHERQSSNTLPVARSDLDNSAFFVFTYTLPKT